MSRRPGKGHQGTAGMTTSSGGASRPGKERRNDNKMRSLEDFMSTFPVDNPQSSEVLARMGTGGLGGGAGGVDYDGVDSPKARRGEAQGDAGKKGLKKTGTTHENVNTSGHPGRKGRDVTAALDIFRRQKIDQWVQFADKNNKKLRRENEALSKIATLTQENAINNDLRFEESINGLRAEVDYTVMTRQDGTETIAALHELSSMITDKINAMRTAAEQQAAKEKENIKVAFERQIKKASEELSSERESGKNTTGQWVTKNRSMQQTLEDLLLKIEATHGANRKLVEKCKKAQVEHDAQASDIDIINDQYSSVVSHHRRLKDRIHDLEVELTGLIHGNERAQQERAESEATMMAAMNTLGDAEATPEEKESNFEAGLRRAKQLLEVESQNLKAVRHQHVLALKQRTELEVFLRQAILHHQKRKKEDARHMNYGNFTADDRRKVIESLFTKERVLYLLYEDDKCIGSGANDATTAGDEAVAMNELWEKWKRWTRAADQAAAAE